MRIALVMKPSIHVGSSIGALNIVSHDPSTFIPVSSDVMGGKEGLSEVEMPNGQTLYYPINSLMSGLGEIDPDCVLLYYLNEQIWDNIDKIVETWPTAYRFNANPIELSLRGDMRQNLPHILSMPSKVDAVITTTRSVERNLNALNYMNTVTIPTCLNVGDFKPAEPDEDLVVSMTRISSIKNLITSILAMRSVINDIPSAKYEIYGKGELEDYVKRFVMMTRSDRISFEGFEHADKILPKAKVLLQLSLSENQSLSPLEAQASKVPVVCSSISGHPQKGACRVPHDSIHQTAEEVKRLLTDDEYWEKKREEGYEEVQKFDVKKVVPCYKSLFSKLMKLEGEFKR